MQRITPKSLFVLPNLVQAVRELRVATLQVVTMIQATSPLLYHGLHSYSTTAHTDRSLHRPGNCPCPTTREPENAWVRKEVPWSFPFLELAD